MNIDERIKKSTKRQAEIKRFHMAYMANIARQLYKFSKMHDSVKSRICKAKTLLEENKDNYDPNLYNPEFQAVLEAENDILKELQVEELEVEMEVTELQRMRRKGIKTAKKIYKLKLETMEIRREHVKQKRELMEEKTHVMKLQGGPSARELGLG